MSERRVRRRSVSLTQDVADWHAQLTDLLSTALAVYLSQTTSSVEPPDGDGAATRVDVLPDPR
jgi:hypothetical protein